ncbi:hypothetical protein P4475_04055 [Halalkalibacterium halodurans]|uniref:hypothetical protein n=1 Tax=Halalkalibacterium halodurans TaxID=86665 RepID=UPI002E1D03BD|nr:hypothetical protein [Halalkalibacterium halodurans]
MLHFQKLFNHVLWMTKGNLHLITLENIERKMVEYGFDRGLRQKVISAFEKRLTTYGEIDFQLWFSRLHYSTPEEFQHEQVAISLYKTYQPWFDAEVKKLEQETDLSWVEQTEDLVGLQDEARKAQLVLRYRLSEIQLDLTS